MKTLESKRNALFVYREKYEKLFEELCIEADPESLVNIQGDYKTFQEKCTGIEEIIDIMLQNFFGETFKEDKTEETSMLEVVKELCDSQMESLRKITAYQQESIKEIATNISRSQGTSGAETKLPQLDLKSFSGGYSQWTEFYDTFKCAGDSRTNLAPVQKLQYLKSCLKGEAAALIRNLNLNDGNYSIAIDLLKGRYENIKNIREAHFDNIFSIASITKKNAANFRKFCSLLEENLQALHILGEPVEQWNS